MPGRAGRVEHPCRRAEAGAGEVEVVAHRVDVAAGPAEVDLPVDVDERGARRVDGAVVRPGVGLGVDRPGADRSAHGQASALMWSIVVDPGRAVRAERGEDAAVVPTAPKMPPDISTMRAGVRDECRVERRAGVDEQQALEAAVVGAAHGGVHGGLEPEADEEQVVAAAARGARRRAGRRRSRRSRRRRRPRAGVGGDRTRRVSIDTVACREADSWSTAITPSTAPARRTMVGTTAAGRSRSLATTSRPSRARAGPGDRASAASYGHGYGVVAATSPTPVPCHGALVACSCRARACDGPAVMSTRSGRRRRRAPRPAGDDRRRR